MASVMQNTRLLALSATLLTAGCLPPREAAPPPMPAVTAVSQPAQEAADTESEARVLSSKVTKVTVYSDRARITREANVKIPGKPTVFAFRGLPGWVDDGSVQLAASAGRIVDVRVDRGFLAAASDEGWRRLEAEHKAVMARFVALQDELAILDAQKAQIQSIQAFSLAKFSQDTTMGDVSVQSYADVLAFITASLRKTAEERRAVQAEMEDLTPELQASQRRLDDTKALMQLEETNILVTLQATDSTAASIQLTYMLPGATWEPMHELRANTSGNSVEVVSFAAVTQTSGEDWGGAELSFSTQSSTQSVHIPELEALTLGDTVTATRLMTNQVSSFTRAQSAFQNQSELWNRFHQSSATERSRTNLEHVYESNMEYLQVVQGRTVKIFESLERRGTTAHFKAQAAQSVRGDGHPVKLQIGSATLSAVQKIVAAPEQSLNAARTLAMANSTDQPFLPGKVSLFQDGAFIGMTDMDFVAKGEQFALFLSVADQLKLSRELDKKQSSLVRKTRNQMQVMFIVTVENLGAETTAFTLADRVPVSENKDIKVSQVTITPTAKPDSQGLIHWDLTLAPGERREFHIGYQVEYPLELYIETNRRRAIEQSMPASPYALDAAPAAKSRVEDQIMDLEDQF